MTQFAMEMSLDTSKDKLKDVLKVYKGLTKESVIAQGKYSRPLLTDTVFALKDIAEELIGIIEKQLGINKQDICDTLMEKFSNLLKQTMPNAIKSAVQSTTITHDEVAQKPEEKEKFTLLIEKGNDEVFNKESWSEVTKRNISHKLKNVPVKKAAVTKEGQGYLLLPSKEAQDQAEMALKEDFNVTKAVKSQSMILPKLKIFDVDDFSKDDKSLLKNAIVEKNECIDLMIKNGKTFDVIFIDEVNKCAVVKVSPEIRNAVLKYGSVYIDMKSHKVKDHVHIIQCFACQKYGHKQGSEYCEHHMTDNFYCRYCSGNHRSTTCSVKHDTNKHRCINCVSSKVLQHQENSCHASSSSYCPIAKKEKEAIIRRTSYCEAKNV